jgi:hypothetical protein
MTIPEQAIEAAARTVFAEGVEHGWWKEPKTYEALDPIGKEEFDAVVNRAIEAAQPLMGVQRPEEIARQLRILLQAGGNLSDEEVAVLERNILALLPVQVQRPEDVAREICEAMDDRPNRSGPYPRCAEGSECACWSAAEAVLALPHTGQPQEGDTQKDKLIEKLHVIAKNVSHALMSFTPGGSEYFTRVQVGDFEDYYADADACQRRVRERINSAEERARTAPQAGCAKEVRDAVRQYREAWREIIDQVDSEASHRENWDGSDHNLQAFDLVMDYVSASPPPPVAESGWQEIESAPRDATEVELRIPKKGHPGFYRQIAHWADGGGDDQPRFRGWFRDTGYGFAEIGGEPDAWRPAQPLPAPPHIAEEQTK